MSIITAIIPVLNRAPVIGNAIESVLAQELPTGYSIKVIVVDDGSTDDLASVLDRFGPRVTCIKHERNKGAAAARNTGIGIADGDLLAFLDSDDIWLPQKLVRQITYMKTNGYVASCTACKLVRPSATDVIWPNNRTGILTKADIVWGCVLSPGTTMICEPSVFKEIGTFDTTLKRHEDWDWLLRFTDRFDLAYLGMPLALREPSPYANRLQVQDALRKIAAKHLRTLPPLLRRRFEAAIAWDTAAAYYREGNRVASMLTTLKSLWLAPVGHPALGAIVSKFSRP
jgi:glycosyltransferase involved in cell wall biosynthesis